MELKLNYKTVYTFTASLCTLILLLGITGKTIFNSFTVTLYGALGILMSAIVWIIDSHIDNILKTKIKAPRFVEKQFNLKFKVMLTLIITLTVLFVIVLIGSYCKFCTT